MDSSMMALMVIMIVVAIAEIIIIKRRHIKPTFFTRQRKIILPRKRPINYFLEGDSVVVVNTNMSRRSRDQGRRFFPENSKRIILGVVTHSSAYDDKCVKIQIEGREHAFTRSCPMIMHDWEYDILKANAFVRKKWAQSSNYIRWFNPRQFEKAIRCSELNPATD